MKRGRFKLNLLFKNTLLFILFFQLSNSVFSQEIIQGAERVDYYFNKLNDKSLIEWTNKYNFNKTDTSVAIIMAGNFPLAGFHDFICVLLSGNKIIVKPSSDDKILICFFIDFLKDSFPELKDCIYISFFAMPKKPNS